MGRKNKLFKFSEILSFPNVYECYNVQIPTLTGAGMQPVDLKGKWHSDHFKNDKPITLELACGYGEYAVALGERYPDRNFIGVDIKGNRLWKGARSAIDHNLDNVAFLRTRIEVIAAFFAPGEVDEIWITFADPFPRSGKENRRLTSAYFINQFRKVLRPGGLVHIKHDDPDFYQFSLDEIASQPDCKMLYTKDDIYADPLDYPELDIRTRYENSHLEKGKKIKYIRYVLGG